MLIAVITIARPGARDEHEVWGGLQVAVGAGHHRPPLRRRRILRAEAEEAQAGGVDDRSRERESALDDHGRDRVRQDVRSEDQAARDAHGARREDEVVLALREHGAP